MDDLLNSQHLSTIPLIYCRTFIRLMNPQQPLKHALSVQRKTVQARPSC